MEILWIMSDLSIRLTALEQPTQLPVRHYLDAGVFADERIRLFQRGPRYVGHDLWVPERGDFHTLPQEAEGRALVRGEQGPQGPVSAIIQKLSDLYLPPLLSPMRTTRSGGRPISFVQMSKASSSSLYTVANRRSGGSL